MEVTERKHLTGTQRSVSSVHLNELQTQTDVLDLLLVPLDHLLHLLAVHVGVDRICDLGRRRRDAAGRRHADPHRRDDDGGPEGEGGQDESGDGGHAARHAGHAPAHGGRHRLLVEVVRGVGHRQQLQDALLQRRPPLVEEVHEHAGRHVDPISHLLHRPAETPRTSETPEAPKQAWTLN